MTWSRKEYRIRNGDLVIDYTISGGAVRNPLSNTKVPIYSTAIRIESFINSIKFDKSHSKMGRHIPNKWLVQIHKSTWKLAKSKWFSNKAGAMKYAKGWMKKHPKGY